MKNDIIDIIDINKDTIVQINGIKFTYTELTHRIADSIRYEQLVQDTNGVLSNE